MKKLFKTKNKIIKLFIICFLIGALISFIYFKNISKEDLNIIINNIKENELFFNVNSNAFDHLKLLSLILLFSLMFIGMPIFVGLIVGESFSLLIRFFFAYKAYKFKGVIYILLLTIFDYGIYIFILYLLFRLINKIIYTLYKYKIKNEIINYNQIYLYLKRGMYLIIINLIYDYLLCLYGIHLLKLFRYICKI